MTQGMAIGQQVKEDGESEGSSVMEEIGVFAPQRKLADFRLVSPHERTCVSVKRREGR
jgi:hypothetical protein